MKNGHVADERRFEWKRFRDVEDSIYRPCVFTLLIKTIFIPKLQLRVS